MQEIRGSDSPLDINFFFVGVILDYFFFLLSDQSREAHLVLCGLQSAKSIILL